jgi:succinate dehydrogenase flavin-adding protein (antitoxin of CptAB toxin-antitoxin module)
MIYEHVEFLDKDTILSRIKYGNEQVKIMALLSLFMNRIDKRLAIKYANWAMQAKETDIVKIGILGMGYIARVYGLKNADVFKKNIERIEQSKNAEFISMLDDAKGDFGIFIKGYKKSHKEKNTEIIKDIKPQLYFGINGYNAVYTIGSSALLRSFFSTIAYKLENNEWGSRFPIIMKCLYYGKIKRKDIKKAIEEAETIKKEFQELPVKEIVWNFKKRKQKVPCKYNKFIIDNAYNFYITENNHHLINHLLRALAKSVECGIKPLKIIKE